MYYYVTGRGIQSSQDGQCVENISYNFYVAFFCFLGFSIILCMDNTKSINYCLSPFLRINLFINNKYGAEQTKQKSIFLPILPNFFLPFLKILRETDVLNVAYWTRQFHVKTSLIAWNLSFGSEYTRSVGRAYDSIWRRLFFRGRTCTSKIVSEAQLWTQKVQKKSYYYSRNVYVLYFTSVTVVKHAH